MRFTIVTPNLNMGNFLEETICSVLENIHNTDQYFIVDGGSKDESIKIINKYKKFISGWISEPDKGYADAIHKGFMMGESKYQCWINSGDLLLPGALDSASKSLEEMSTDFIYGDDFYIDEFGAVLKYSKGMCKNLKESMLFGGWTPLQDACYWSSELYKKVGGINVDLKNAADFDLFLKFSINTVPRYVPLAFSAFRRHASQKSIAHNKAYRLEKKRCQSFHQENLLCNKFLKMYYTFKYSFAMRFRARIMEKVWNLPELQGKKIQQFICGAYR